MAIKFPLSFVVQAVDKATTSLRGINRRIRQLTNPVRVPLLKLGNSLTAFSKEAGLPQLVDRFKGVGTSVRSVADEAGALGKRLVGLAVVAGGFAFVLAHGAIDAGDKLSEMSQRLGMSANSFAQLQFAAEQADVSQDQFADSMDKLNKGLGEMRAGGGPLLAFLQKVSPTLLRQLKATHSTGEAFYLLSHAFEAVKDPGKRAALTAVTFGKGAKAMGEFAGMGEKAIDALRARFGEIAGDQELFAVRASNADNALREGQVAMEAVRNVLVTGLLPAVTRISTALADFIAKHRFALAQWAEETGAAISAWVDGRGLERLGATLQRIGTVLGMVVERLGGVEGVVKLVALAMSAKLLLAVGQSAVALAQLGGSIAMVAVRLGGLLFAPVVAAIGTFITAIVAGTGVTGAFNAVLLANPIGLIILAVVALAAAVYAIYKNWRPISGFFKKIWGTIVDGNVRAFTALRGFFSKLWDDIVGFFEGAWEKIKPIVDVMMKVASFTPTGLAIEAGKSAMNWWQSRDQPALGAAGALPASASGGATRVMVDFSNIPKGVRVAADPQGDAPLDLSRGYSMVPP